jgi:23S rRNA (cytidine1920-2'-O)/16S rRNA (cytidine1409-2'-O)-methyltransferase
MERTNFRYVTSKEVPEMIDFASCDVSFISLSRILPAARPLLKDEGEMVCLIKPQFEAGREKVGKKGVVRDKKVHAEVIEAVKGYAVENGFCIQGLDFSPVRGPEGNIEYLIYLAKDGKPGDGIYDRNWINDLVDRAHDSLGGS